MSGKNYSFEEGFKQIDKQAAEAQLELLGRRLRGPRAVWTFHDGDATASKEGLDLRAKVMQPKLASRLAMFVQAASVYFNWGAQQ